jgi:hypothetical protein
MAVEEPMAPVVPDEMSVWAVTGRAGGPGRLRAEVRPVPSPVADEVLVEV